MKRTAMTAAALITACALTFCSCSADPADVIRQLISSEENDMKAKEFDCITIDITGTMASTREYELLRTDNGARLSLYDGAWEFDDELTKEECLRKRIEGDSEFYAELLDLANECGLKKWDGFSKSASGVLDGESFTLRGTVDGKAMSARGSNAYPSGFHDLTRALWDMLSEKE
ncbi:MAG: hypothetical protein J6O50_09150 [Ruminiclostridium sp.]|nr:hypothetical protein [Ruminiclostridium sp.]